MNRETIERIARKVIAAPANDFDSWSENAGKLFGPREARIEVGITFNRNLDPYVFVKIDKTPYMDKKVFLEFTIALRDAAAYSEILRRELAKRTKS